MYFCRRQVAGGIKSPRVFSPACAWEKTPILSSILSLFTALEGLGIYLQRRYFLVHSNFKITLTGQFLKTLKWYSIFEKALHVQSFITWTCSSNLEKPYSSKCKIDLYFQFFKTRIFCSIYEKADILFHWQFANLLPYLLLNKGQHFFMLSFSK